jgi:hypothetical protein
VPSDIKALTTKKEKPPKGRFKTNSDDAAPRIIGADQVCRFCHAQQA